MNISAKQPVAILEHETALQVYLDALLQDMSESIYSEEPQKTLVEEKVLEQDNILESVLKIAEGSAPFVVHEHRSPNKVLTWVTTPFQSLLFSTHGVRMVVPLIQLHSIVNLTAPIKYVQSNAAWFMGLFPWRGTYVKVIDIYKLMAMESAEFKDTDESSPKRIVLINDGSWGFVCDDVSKVFTLYPGQIQWRSDRTYRAWLVGTVIEYMCVLLDVDEFALHVSGISPAARLMPANSCEDAVLVF